MLVLLIGDLEWALKTSDLPLKFKKLLVPGKIQHILCTGNLGCPLALDYLRSICSEISLVQGDFDPPFSLAAPVRKVSFGSGIQFGLVPGHQDLPWNDLKMWEMRARQLDVDVLVSGSNGFSALESNGRFYVSPGSATGAYAQKIPSEEALAQDAGNPRTIPESIPSFVLMDIQELNVVFYIYKLIKGEVKVEKMDFVKKIFD